MEEKSISTIGRGAGEDSTYFCRAKEIETISIDNIMIELNEEVYKPSDDTYIVVDAFNEVLHRSKRLINLLIEVGSGSGYITISILKTMLLRSMPHAILIDISPCAVTSSWNSIKLNDLDMYSDVIQCDGLSCIRSFVADIIVFNPPYLPVEDSGSWLARSWSGGIDGLSVWLKFFEESLDRCKHSICTIIFTLSTLQNIEKALGSLGKNCIAVDFYKCKSFFFETICVVGCNR
ncbi:MAG: methyltransferase [Ignisphaera sp.]